MDNTQTFISVNISPNDLSNTLLQVSKATKASGTLTQNKLKNIQTMLRYMPKITEFTCVQFVSNETKRTKTAVATPQKTILSEDVEGASIRYSHETFMTKSNSESKLEIRNLMQRFQG